jgi:hypothetical protein
MMMTALLIFLGLSACATLAILSAVALSARRSMPSDGGSSFETQIVTGPAPSSEGALVRAYSH